MKKILSVLFGLILLLNIPVTAHAAGPLGNTKVAVFLINWQDDTEQPISISLADSQMFTASNSVSAYYDATSYGKMHLVGDILGWYTVPYDSVDCQWPLWRDWTYNQVAQTTDMSQYQYLVYAWPVAHSCGVAGLANIGGTISYDGAVTTNSISTALVAHELGHNFGLDHANARICYDSNGTQVQVSNNCTNSEYGDHYDVMGNSNMFTMNAIHRTTLGWLPESNTQTITSAGIYHIYPLEWNTNQIQQLQIKIPKQGRTTFSDYFVEIRQTYGWDDFQENGCCGVSWGVNGIAIHQRSSTLAGLDTYLMDATPNSPDIPSGATFYDQTLFVGKTFYDEAARVKITTLTIDSNGATVKVEYLKK